MGISGGRAKLGIAVGVVLLLVVLGGLVSVFPSASNQGYDPEQPIPFSHKIHAGDNHIPCMYCHTNVERSRHATVPALNVCMNCHRVVKTDSPWIKEVRQHFIENKPIQWIRVHELPDYVYFPHKRHIAKGIACQTCHGPVERMDRIYQWAPLTMGWCIECHRGQSTPKYVLRRIFPDLKYPHGRLKVAPTECSTCHK